VADVEDAGARAWQNQASAAGAVDKRGAAMIRFGCDSEDLSALLPMDFVRTYSDLVPSAGALAELEARFPGSQVMLGDRGLGDPTGRACWFDVERFALTPADMPGKLIAKAAQGITEIDIYGTVATLDEVVGRIGGHGWWRWYAYWGGGLHVPGHPLAQVQFASAGMLGGGVDLTAVHNDYYRPRAAEAYAIQPEIINDPGPVPPGAGG
jgi:hypothetical protein